MSTTAPTRFLLDSDDDGHWYLVPAALEVQFNEYVDSNGEGTYPVGVLSLGSHPNTVTFEKPQHFGEDVA